MPTNGSVARISTDARAAASRRRPPAPAHRPPDEQHRPGSDARTSRTPQRSSPSAGPGRATRRPGPRPPACSRCPATRSTSTGWLKAATANTSSWIVGRTGITAQASASSPTRSRNHDDGRRRQADGGERQQRHGERRGVHVVAVEARAEGPVEHERLVETVAAGDPQRGQEVRLEVVAPAHRIEHDDQRDDKERQPHAGQARAASAWRRASTDRVSSSIEPMISG